MTVRTGIGYDVHRLESGRRLVLGGVEVPGGIGLAGHSDADVLTHAVIDALLGAAGLGDIGLLFPDTDSRYAGADSIELLREVVRRITADGWQIANIDCTLALEQPRLGPYRDAIQRSLAEGVGIGADRVNVKATTGEGIGFVGRKEGAIAYAVATLEGGQ
jgi:2-C-methyl-D-erythritol 2,4-cyclodiphosphate synthase